jgi:hypothetical protein
MQRLGFNAARSRASQSMWVGKQIVQMSLPDGRYSVHFVRTLVLSIPQAAVKPKI